MAGYLLSLAAHAEILSVLEGCSEYFEARASAEYFTDSPDPCGNEEMHLLTEVGYAIREMSLARNQVSA